MITVEIGKRILGKTEYIPRAMLIESVPGQIYEVEIRTKGVSNPEQAISTLNVELPKKFNGLKVHWIGADGSVIKMQITGSPFAWAAFMLFLPSILTVIGIAVTLIAVYLVWTLVPPWVTALLIIGTILTLFGSQMGDLIMRGLPKVKG